MSWRFRLGDVVVHRVGEMLSPGFNPAFLFPDFDPAVFDEDPQLRGPNFWDAVTGKLMSSMQSWVFRLGAEIVLPVARWRGYGEDNRRGYCFETMTQAAALASITKNISLFATIHVPLVHPLMTAKCMTTVDHASHGRAGLNVVAGWNQEEFDMFGLSQEEHDGRYEQAHEWCQLFRRLTAGGKPFDHEGTFYRGRGMVAEPGAVQSRMPILNAAVSPAGRAFAAEFSDYIFTFVGIPNRRSRIRLQFRRSPPATWYAGRRGISGLIRQSD